VVNAFKGETPEAQRLIHADFVRKAKRERYERLD
jgi:hypothetical protein